MKKNRRKFLKVAGLAGIGLSNGSLLNAFENHPSIPYFNQFPINSPDSWEENLSIIGQYGQWANSLTAGKLPAFSFRREDWTDLESWRNAARERLLDRLAVPDLGKVPKVSIQKQYNYDGLYIEEISWQLPYGRPTAAILLKPQNAKGPLPGILAFHDHGGNKYFGTRKITKTGEEQHPLLTVHQENYYEGIAWANEIAKRGYVVLVSDTFTFASRRVLMADVPEWLREGLHDGDPENPKHIAAYNKWASAHEHIMAKSLFSAGTTWPGVFFAEDKIALDVLCERKDVDTNRIGCGGLSGGGLRTVLMGGLDPRIKCAVCMGFMTTWKDFVMDKSFTHTWMSYVPISPNELDFPEILGLRTPLPTLVLNNIHDQLFTMPEMERADEMLKSVYAKANAQKQYKAGFYPGPHKFDRKMQAEAFDWFDQWLKA